MSAYSIFKINLQIFIGSPIEKKLKYFYDWNYASFSKYDLSRIMFSLLMKGDT